MAKDPRRPAHEDTPVEDHPGDPSLESLREILFGAQVSGLREEIAELERRVTDRDTLIGIISPVLADAIRRKIRDARDEMIEALYPILGQLVVRAVSEAIRDLARTIDAQMRTKLSPRRIWRRWGARLRGVSSAEMALRESLPFSVTEVLLIHRESGLLLWHVSRDHDTLPDSDLVSGMLTAIRDFSRDTFGQAKEGQLDEIQYGEQRILIEAAQHAYLAVVVDGVEPAGFRAQMRELIIEVNHTHQTALRDYGGDPAPLASVEGALRSLFTAAEPRQLRSAQKRVLAAVAALTVVCLVGSCLTGLWAQRRVFGTPTPLPVAVEPSSTATATTTWTATATATPSPTLTATSPPTATPLPTSTPTPSPTATSTDTPTPTKTATPRPTVTPSPTFTPTPETVVGVMIGSVWVRQGPSTDAERLGMILDRGRAVEILAVFGNWCQVRWSPQEGAAVVGWVPLRWVGTMTPIPARIMTPTPTS